MYVVFFCYVSLLTISESSRKPFMEPNSDPLSSDMLKSFVVSFACVKEKDDGSTPEMTHVEVRRLTGETVLREAKLRRKDHSEVHELTLAMTEVLASHPESPFADKCVRVLGLDLDINLIEGAKKKLYDSSNYQIHLNHGDEGLKFFFERISKCGQVVLVEPQPWKCYQSAVHRLRRCEAGGEFPHWKSIQLRSTEQIEAAIGSLLTSDARRSRYDLGDGVATAWGRKLLLYG
ncbi:unnamed protein product [Cyprideis torosa]|uniref:RNA methyltransferase n=1 Tax=Cyprideis torosa TaxID=163714 RepID=A0A7R8W5X6_9CRUS|nr:unnamed protein product [Cyprideis torosa]CAG0885854.1 unnamed protein product [Cyprideis torosa]